MFLTYLRISIRVFICILVVALARADQKLNDARLWLDRWIEIAGTESAAEMISVEGLHVTTQTCDGERTELLAKSDWARTDFNFLSVYSEIACEANFCRVTAPGEGYSFEFSSQEDGSVSLVTFAGYADISPGDCGEEQ
jgi:hypothetical protein